MDLETEAAPPIHSVGGLLDGERALIAFAGNSDSGENWFLHWYRKGHMVVPPKGPFRTPEEALEHFISIR
jgi:hypothetical protein